jgi:hypothetical protein
MHTALREEILAAVPLRLAERPASIAETAHPPRNRRGRPVGSDGPLALWLKPQIRRFKTQGARCRNTFLALSVVEGGDEERFEVSEETADSLLRDLGTNIAGRVVTYENFRKTWQSVKLF